MYEKICYKKPFLKEVILRIDFPSPIQGLENSLPRSISKVALKKFPISEPRKVHGQEFQISGPSIQAKPLEMMNWIFHGRQREKHLTIAPNAIIFSTKKYASFEDFIDETNSIINEFFNEYKELSASRVGLRYINNLDINETDPLSWDKYINKQMLGLIKFHGDNDCTTRVFHILEYNFEGQALKFQFGIANPDYPAVVKRKQFVLDLDSWFNGAIEEKDIFTFVESAHGKIQELFEKSITAETRRLMKIRNE